MLLMFLLLMWRFFKNSLETNQIMKQINVVLSGKSKKGWLTKKETN